MRAKIAFLAGLLLLSLLLPIAAQSSYNVINPQGSIWTGNDQRLGQMVLILTAGLAAAVAGISVIYMSLGILRSAEYEAQLKGEVYQLAITVVWGIGIFMAAALMNNVLSTYSGGDIFDLAGNYISRVNCLSISSVTKLEGMKLGAQYLGSMMGKYYAGAWGFKVPIMPGMEVVERAIDIIQMMMTPFGASLMVQQIGLQIIKATALLYLLPAGLLLRLFPMTREAGSFMIATAFAFYFVLPFTYVIHAQVMGQLYFATYGYNMCGGFDASGGEWLQSFQIFDGTARQTLPINPSSISSLNSRFPYNLTALLDPMEHLSFIAVQSVFLPALSMVLVVTFIRTVMKFFSQRAE